MRSVYLADGFRSGWQKVVKDACVTKNEDVNTLPLWDSFPSFDWNDPFEKERGEFSEDREWTAKEYTSLDLFLIDQSDIVFVYLEKDNPGLGCIAEAGYAKGKGKYIILVRERPHEIHTDRYLDFLEEMCDITFNNLEDGITFLKTFK